MLRQNCPQFWYSALSKFPRKNSALFRSIYVVFFSVLIGTVRIIEVSALFSVRIIEVWLYQIFFPDFSENSLRLDTKFIRSEAPKSKVIIFLKKWICNQNKNVCAVLKVRWVVLLGSISIPKNYLCSLYKIVKFS